MEPLAPGMRRVGALLRRLPGSSIASVDPDTLEKRQATKVPEGFAFVLMGTRPRSVSTEDRRIGDIPIRIYTPKRASVGLRPLVVYFHGGGFVTGDLRGGDWISGSVADQLDAVVVSAGYRLAPKHPFPAAIDDCYTALEWAATNAASLWASADRIGVMGESAGGNLAAVVALLARDRRGPRILHQGLMYPATGGGDTESRRLNATAIVLTAEDMEVFGRLYGGDPKDWRVSPLKAASFAGLPPALIQVAGHDPLHDDGVLYASALRDAGVPVTLTEYASMPHGFVNFPRFARDAKPAIAELVAAQKVALG
jgi:acetyl esterase